MYVWMTLVGYFIVVFAVYIPTDNLHIQTDDLHIHKKITGGYVDSIQWGESSFIMNIPADCFPKEEEVDVFLSIEYYHHLEIPKGYKLLSPTYNIVASKGLQKAVTITLKHNAVVTRQEEAESLAILHYSDEEEMKILQGKTEINSTFISFQMSELCRITVIGADSINQHYSIAFYRQQPSSESIDPLLKIRAIFFLDFFPFTLIQVFLLNNINTYYDSLNQYLGDTEE